MIWLLRIAGCFVITMVVSVFWLMVYQMAYGPLSNVTNTPRDTIDKVIPILVLSLLVVGWLVVMVLFLAAIGVGEKLKWK